MQTISNEESFRACWVKTVLYHVLTKKEILHVGSHLKLVTPDDRKRSRNELIRIIASGSKQDELIQELDAALMRKGISPHLFDHLKGLYQKMEALEPSKLANIYLHMSEGGPAGEMATQVYNGEDLRKVFSHELMTMILYEVLAKAENKSLMVFEHIVNRSSIR